MKMEDIAKMAQVSKAAVSLAFSGKPGIGPETRDRILLIAREAGYKPKSRITTGTNKVVKSILFLVFTNSGIVLEEYYQQPFFKELIQFVGERCRQRNYELIFTTIDMKSFELGVENLAKEQRSDGVIVLGTNLTAEQISVLGENLSNLVVLDTCFDTLPLSFIEINNVMGAYQAGRYLIEHGHTSIGYIASNVRIHNFDERERGFIKALEEHGLSIENSYRLSVAPTILSSQEELKKQLIALQINNRPLPTAWFCECDYIAISAMKTMFEFGKKVPHNCSIIGFDNITEARVITPELTTVQVEKERMAAYAVDLLARGIEHGDNLNIKIKVDTTFIERGSCAFNEVNVSPV
ncbi:LacI family DNA-binding transcriptional regulator [Paenibacillus camerounensis]|uniref:LacI family DNA-binding transcriptional regulator n=1 Tax=Paenibacillus camerounensis TaxID=1243663 RepID=UPI0005A6845C|nr:LacI family DNA-binding transcriptional regulator [Paenibacillus camerounensis]